MGGRPQFSIFGIPVRIEPFFPIILFVLALTAYQGSLIFSFVAVAAISVLIHELGHALAYRRYGMHPRIVLHGWGGLTMGTGELSPGRSILVSLAGPVPPLLLFGIPALIFRSSAHLTGDVDQLLWQIVWINVGWSLLNLLPVLPLDGGNVCASGLELLFRGHGRQIANVVSLVLVGALALFALLAFQPFILILAVFFGATNVMELTRREPGAPAAESLVEAHRALLAGDPGRGEVLAQEGVARARSPEEQRWGRELMAWSHLLAGDVAGAQQLAGMMATTQPVSQSFYGSLSLAMGRRDEGLTVLTWAFAHETAGPAKSLAALVAARAGVVEALTHQLQGLGTAGGNQAAELLAQLVAYNQTQGRWAALPPDASPRWPGGPSGPAGPPTAPDPVPIASPPGPGPTAALPPPPSPRPPPGPAPGAWPSEPPSAPPSEWRRPD